VGFSLRLVSRQHLRGGEIYRRVAHHQVLVALVDVLVELEDSVDRGVGTGLDDDTVEGADDQLVGRERSVDGVTRAVDDLEGVLREVDIGSVGCSDGRHDAGADVLDHGLADARDAVGDGGRGLGVVELDRDGVGYTRKGVLRLDLLGDRALDATGGRRHAAAGRAGEERERSRTSNGCSHGENDDRRDGGASLVVADVGAEVAELGHASP